MTEKPDSVRIATRADEEAIYHLLVALHRHNANGWGFPFRPELVLRRIQQATRPDPATRSDPHDQTRGIIGLIDGAGRPVGTVGVFLEPPMWFSDCVVPTELWLFVRPEAREHHEKALFDFALWVRDRLRPKDWPLPFPLQTGFLHRGERYEALDRLWRRRSGGRKVGSLFWVD